MKQLMITNMLPTLVWNVSITPIKAHITLWKESVSDFLVRLCGIVGGIFAAATIFESLLRNGLCIMFPSFDSDEGQAEPAKPRPSRVETAPVIVDTQKSEAVQMVSQDGSFAEKLVVKEGQ